MSRDVRCQKRQLQKEDGCMRPASMAGLCRIKYKCFMTKTKMKWEFGREGRSHHIRMLQQLKPSNDL